MSGEGLIITAGAVVAALACALLLIAAWRLRRRRLSAALLSIPAVVAGTLAALFFWMGHRPLPPAVRETLYPGVEYVRAVRSTPRSLVIHVVTIELDAPGLGFLVTPGEPGQPLPASTVSQFLTQHELQIAINGGFFEPTWDNGMFDYYPHEGDPVSPPAGIYASRGNVYWDDPRVNDTVYLSADNRVSFGAPAGEVYNALTGYITLLAHGQNVLDALGFRDDERHPRTAVGTNEAEDTLILMVIDGRQPNYSEGVTLPELIDLLREFGAYHALSLDGGGSSTLVVEGADGAPRILNSPIHTRIPGRERPVATHLGVFIRHD